MTGISFDPELSDVNNDGYVSGPVSVTSVQVEAKVDLTRLSGRECLTITNKGPNKVWYGPSGVTTDSGDYLLKDQFVSLPIGEGLGVFLICSTGQTATVVVQEMA
jgi:hypothetical protein